MRIGLLVLVLMLSSVSRADIVLRFSWWGGSERLEATRQVIRLFELRHPGVRIRPEAAPWVDYFDRLQQQLSQGQEPDIMQINWAWLSVLSPRGEGFYDLNSLRDSLRLEEFAGGRDRDGLVMGKLNGVSVSHTARVFLWHGTVLDRAGLQVPQTWDQLFVRAGQLRERLGDDHYLLDADHLDAVLLSYAYILQHTGKPFIHNNQPRVAYDLNQALAWIRFYKALYARHVLPPYQEREAKGGLARPPEQQADWIEGRWAGLYVWDSQLRSRALALGPKARVVVGPFLTMENARNSGMLGRPTMMLSISKHCAHPEVAARFIAFMLTDPAAVKLLGTTRGIPLTRTGKDTLQKSGLIEPYEARANEQIRSVRILHPSPYFESPAMLEFLQQLFADVSSGKVDDQAAAEALIQGANEVLQKLR